MMRSEHEVCALLCDLCKHRVADAPMSCDEDDPERTFAHYANGERLKCLASRFRVLAARDNLADSKLSPDTSGETGLGKPT